MRLAKPLLAVFLVASFFSVSIFASRALAAGPTVCSNVFPGFLTTNTWPTTVYIGGIYGPQTFSVKSSAFTGQYKASCSRDADLFWSYTDYDQRNATADSNHTVTFTFPSNLCFQYQSSSTNRDSTAYIKIEPVPNPTPSSACTVLTYQIVGNSSSNVNCGTGLNITYQSQPSACFAVNDSIGWSISGMTASDGKPINGSYKLFIDNTNVQGTNVNIVNGSANGTATINAGSVGQTLSAEIDNPETCRASGCAFDDANALCKSASSNIFNSCTPTDRSATPGTGSNGSTFVSPDFALCDQVSGADKTNCQICFCGSAGCTTSTASVTSLDNKKLWTAFGCVDVSKEGIVTDFLRIGLGLAGGFVLLTTLYGAFLLTTSSGDMKRVQEAQEQITSSVMGLIFVIFSVIILQFIGVTILHIPGFGS